MTIIVILAGILFDLFGFLDISIIQSIAAILVIVACIILFILTQIIYLNVNKNELKGKRLIYLTHLLLLLLAFIPILIGLTGLLWGFGVFFSYPVSFDATSLGLAFNLMLYLLQMGFGLLIAVLYLDLLKD